MQAAAFILDYAVSRPRSRARPVIKSLLATAILFGVFGIAPRRATAPAVSTVPASALPTGSLEGIPLPIDDADGV